MNIDFNPFHTPLGKIRPNGDSIIEYHIFPNVQWVVKNYGAADERWYSQKVENWGIKEYSLNERYIEHFKSEIEKQSIIEQQRKQLYLEINKPLANVNYVDFPKSAAFTIYQHEYGITTAKSRMPILGTWGASPCLILALYDDENEIAALTHIDSSREVKSLTDIFRHFDLKSTVAHLHGGKQYSFDLCLDIVEFIKSRGIKIENCALIEHSNGNASLAIDARNGRLYSSVEPWNLTPCINEASKMRSIFHNATCNPLVMGYDGLNDLGEANLMVENKIFHVVSDAVPTLQKIQKNQASNVGPLLNVKMMF